MNVKYMIMREDGVIFSKTMNEFVDRVLALNQDDIFDIYYETRDEAQKVIDKCVQYGKIDPENVTISRMVQH